MTPETVMRYFYHCGLAGSATGFGCQCGKAATAALCERTIELTVVPHCVTGARAADTTHV